MSDIVNFFILSYSGEMKCPLTGKNCLKHKCFEAEGKLLCEDCFQKKAEGVKSASDTTCPSCGTSLTDVIKNGKLGCAVCYDSFSENIQYIIGSAQMGDPGIAHTGMIPESFLMETARSVSYEELREEIIMRMNSASAKQDYHRAAAMKSKIAELDDINKERGQADHSERLALFAFGFWKYSEAFY